MTGVAARAVVAAPGPLGCIRERIAAIRLNLDGLHVVTEAATGAYACTAVIAALAGAHVTALARSTIRHGSARDAELFTLGLAREAGVANRIAVVDALAPEHLMTCHILTNSGHLRPISRRMIEFLPSAAVIALMFEAWEFRSDDLDIAACRERGIRVAGVNERHPDVAVFPFLGPLAVRLLLEAEFQPAGRTVALLCDNPFAPFIQAGLEAAGARVAVFATPELPAASWDAIVFALDPGRNPSMDPANLARLAEVAPGALIAQFWGDLDRAAAASVGFAITPDAEPRRGHMGILLNALGDEPIVRLQTGGLRAAELVYRGEFGTSEGIAQIL